MQITEEPSMIKDVCIKPLKMIPDERGFLMEILRSDDEVFRKFGQIYLTVGYPGVVKGWHYHKIQTDFFSVIKGTMKVVLYDNRENSPTHGDVNEFFMGELNPLLITIPPLVVHGMKAIGSTPGYVINCPTEPYNPAQPDEYRIHPYDNDIPYDWHIKEG
jgi:dTDP-4-dehydrorhamnose 3,5-epimerase